MSAVAVVAAAAGLLGWQVATHGEDVQGTEIVLRTQRLGDGIVVGTRVRADGVVVGKVTDIAPLSLGTQAITLDVDRSQLDGIDDSMKVDYGTSNLFGISEIQLRPGRGGAPLRTGSVVDLTGPRAADAVDATMGNLLRGLATVGDQALAARLAVVLDQLATDTRAFTPLLQAMVVTARTVADNQTLPPSFQLEQLGTTLVGAGQFAGATIDVIDRVTRIEVLRTGRARFDATIDMVTQQLFPGLQTMLYHAKEQFPAYAAMAVPVLDAVGRAVPDPQRSSAELTALLANLRSAFTDTESGPALNVDVDLRIAPVPMIPLLGGQVVPQ
ncbi:MlaD family protein [Nocardia neocaledoniensis]|uniref:MlaD family protein n=1 Tax=Nocardia neocaledoniensis TaxID=236511 RepID=UPI001FCA2CAA|nr:MlaD family protein [Nocardia neocaledoniensis]